MRPARSPNASSSALRGSRRCRSDDEEDEEVEPGGRAGERAAAKARQRRREPAKAKVGPAVHRPHRAVRVRQVAGDPRARGSRLLLRRQPADDADPDAGEAVAPRRRDIEKVAIVVDVREGNFLSSFPRIFRRLRKMPRLNPVLIFLEASHTTLVRRFSETRRPHPLAPDRSASEGIRDERARLNAIREHGRRDRRHVGHDGARAAAVLHEPVARPVPRRGWSSRCSASASSTACRSTPI